MDNQEKMIPLSEAEHEVELACRRIGMLHLAYARTLVHQLGEEQGKRAIVAAIREYGKLVGEQVKQKVIDQGLPNTPENYGQGDARTLPKYGMNDGVVITDSGERQVQGCVMAKVWRELGDEELGGLYCLIDTAKYIYYNSDYKLTHVCSMPAHGTDYCQFELQETTEQEKNDFFNDNDWRYLDKRIIKGEK